MWPYWILFTLPSLAALAARPRRLIRKDGTRPAKINGPSLMIGLVITLMIGLRFQVGGDWPAYQFHYTQAEALTFLEAITRPDPGYWVLNVLSAQLGMGIAGVNLIGGLFFTIGLLTFCLTTPRPWLALCVAIPYLVVVVGMGYSRQAIALGFVMIALTSLERKYYFRFALWVFVGALFHKSAVVIIPIAALTAARNRLEIGTGIAVIAALAYFTLLSDQVDDLVANYIEAGYQSSGALIRLAMNFVPAVILLRFRKRFNLSDSARRVYGLFALISVCLFAAYFTGMPSTALDRLALYMIPLQLLVFSHLPDVLTKAPKRKRLFVMLIVLYSTAVLFVWLNFAANSDYWTPYRIAI